MEWLQVNPVCDPHDIEFLTNKVLRLCNVLERAQLKKRLLLLNHIHAVGRAGKDMFHIFE
jgi:hypothetical protein